MTKQQTEYKTKRKHMVMKRMKKNYHESLKITPVLFVGP